MKPVIRCLVALSLTLAAGCASDAPFYQLAISAPDTVSLSPGESAPVEVSISRESQQTGELRIRLENAPEGITLNPDIVLPEGEENITTTATLAVAADTSATGAYRTLLMAVDPLNDYVYGARFYIVVLPAPTPHPDFSIALEPRQITLFAGQREELTVNVTRAAGFTGPVRVQLESPTPRITAQDITIPEGQTQGRLTVVTDRGVVRLPVALTVAATAEGERRATASFTLNIRQ